MELQTTTAQYNYCILEKNNHLCPYLYNSFYNFLTENHGKKANKSRVKMWPLFLLHPYQVLEREPAVGYLFASLHISYGNLDGKDWQNSVLFVHEIRAECQSSFCFMKLQHTLYIRET